jgi:hypothetical protein
MELQENTDRNLEVVHEKNDKFDKKIETKINRYPINKKIQLKNSVEIVNSRFDQAEKRISKLEDRSFEAIQSIAQKEQRMKKKKEDHENYGTPLSELTFA